MAEEYKFSKKVLEDQGIEAKEGSEVEVKLGEELVKAKIVKIEDDQVIADKVE